MCWLASPAQSQGSGNILSDIDAKHGLSVAANMPCAEMSFVYRYLELLCYWRAVFGGLCLCMTTQFGPTIWLWHYCGNTIYKLTKRVLHKECKCPLINRNHIPYLKPVHQWQKKISTDWVTSGVALLEKSDRVCNKAVNIGGQVTAGAYKYWL